MGLCVIGATLMTVKSLSGNFVLSLKKNIWVFDDGESLPITVLKWHLCATKIES